MTQEQKPSRRLLVEFSDVKVYAFIHEAALYSGKPPNWGGETTITGLAFDRDQFGALGISRRANVRFWPYDVFKPETMLDAEKRPIVGWVDSESAQQVNLCLHIPADACRDLMERVWRSVATPMATRSFEFCLRFSESMRSGDRPGDYITAIYFDHPSARKG